MRGQFALFFFLSQNLTFGSTRLKICLMQSINRRDANFKARQIKTKINFKKDLHSLAFSGYNKSCSRGTREGRKRPTPMRGKATLGTLTTKGNQGH